MRPELQPMIADRVSPRALLAAGLLALPLLVTGCDNPACVFSGNCSSSNSGSLGTNPAELPPDGSWVFSGAPALTAFAPSGGSIGSETPVVLRFSESLLRDTLDGAFEIAEAGSLGGSVPLQGIALVGDGRLVVLLPSTALTNGSTYEVTLADDAEVTDLTGALFNPADALLGSFTVAATDPATPSVIATWPVNNATGASTTTEVVAVFDGDLNLGTVSASSFAVRVGTPPTAPAFNPSPSAVTLIGAGGSTVSDTRVLRWRSLDASGAAVYLGRGLAGRVTVSPAANPILAMAGGAIPERVVDWTFSSIDAPVSARVLSFPNDAIGIANLDGTAPLDVEVTLVDGQVGDTLTTLLFGMLPNTTPARLGARQRTYSLTAVGTTVSLTEAELDIASATSPVAARFEDGPLAFAFSLTRGAERTPVRRLDVDLAVAGIQDPLLDVTAPKLLGFGTSGTVLATFTSDSRGLALNGRADEALRSVVVTSSLGDNTPLPPVLGDGAGGTLPPVVGSRDGGSFVARPAPLGLLDPGSGALSFDVTAYDRALNPAPTRTASFVQVGTVRDSSTVPAGFLEIEVFDALTLLPLAGAQVYLHSDNGGGNLVFSTRSPTGATGSAQLVDLPGGTRVITVDALGYDLFTLHDVTTNRISVPLVPTGTTAAFVQGAVETPSTQLGTLDRRIGDARFRRTDERFAVVNSCNFDAGASLFSCSFGPLPVVPRRLGALGFVAVSVPTDVVFWSPFTFLRAAEFLAPVPAVPPALVGTDTLSVAGLLDATGNDPEELAIDGPRPTLTIAPAALGLGMLDGDPRIAVEARVPGVSGTTPVGSGVAFPAAPNSWDVRSAYPGAADFGPAVGQLGRLVTSGSIDAELLLRCEVRDAFGAIAGARPRVSTNPGALQPLALPLVQAPLCTMAPGTCGGNSGAAPYEIVFDDVIAGSPGLYCVQLTDVLGRGWTIWRADGGGASASVGVPAGATGSPFLANGSVACEVSAFAIPGFAPSSFAWTDVGRLHEGFAHAAPITYVQP